jgi:3-dehydroquinate synthase
MSIRSSRRVYSVAFVADPLPALEAARGERDVVCIDKTVFDLYPAVAAVAAKGPYRLIEPCEEAKSFDALGDILADLLAGGLTKSDRLIAIGGGVTQDITAFTASILFRGIDWLFFPTNLLSQADSCIGSKTSINFGAYKNQLGGFHPPAQIVAAQAFLTTLPRRDLLSGLGEMMHYFCVSGREDFAWASPRIARAVDDPGGLGPLIRRSLAIKKDMIERDEFDAGPRNVFNYGHSFGHALESVSGYAIPHGIAVSFGMDLANCLAVRLGLLPAADRDEMRRALLPLLAGTVPDIGDGAAFFAALRRDKKNEGAVVKVILSRGLGQMFKTSLPLDAAAERCIRDYFAGAQWTKDLCETSEN